MTISKKVILDTLAPFYNSTKVEDHHWKALWTLYEDVFASRDTEIGEAPFAGLRVVQPAYQAVMWYLDTLPEESVIDISVYTDTGMISLSIPIIEIRRLKDSNNTEMYRRFTADYKVRWDEKQAKQAKKDQ